MTDKTIAKTLITMVLAATAMPAFAQVCTPAQECGDVNQLDGVTVADALGVLRRSIGLSVDLTCSCDGTGECPLGGVTETGQTQCWDPVDVAPPIDPLDCVNTGQDGDVRAGIANDFVNNGNGTITDNRTKLQWEILTDDGSIHDWDDFSYQWAGAFGKIEDLNEMAFAGQDDWRVPNIRELQTLLNYSAYNPATHGVFAFECKAGCNSDECSCTKASIYWAATTYQQSSSLAWAVQFQTGLVSNSSKISYNYVRAVRGGVE